MVVDVDRELVRFHDVTVADPSSDPPPGTRLSAILDRSQLPASAVAGVMAAEDAGAAPVLLVPEPAASSTPESVRALRARGLDLIAEGVPADRIVAEVALTSGVVHRITELRRGGLLAGVAVPPTSPPTGFDDPARRGAVVGSLAAAILAGVASVRTSDAASEATAQRVRAIVARLTGSSVG